MGTLYNDQWRLERHANTGAQSNGQRASTVNQQRLDGTDVGPQIANYPTNRSLPAVPERWQSFMRR
jgi:hypothetical protein